MSVVINSVMSEPESEIAGEGGDADGLVVYLKWLMKVSGMFWEDAFGFDGVEFKFVGDRVVFSDLKNYLHF